MICARCQQPIRPGEEYDRTPMHGASGGQPDVIRHLRCPDRTR